MADALTSVEGRSQVPAEESAIGVATVGDGADIASSAVDVTGAADGAGVVAAGVVAAGVVAAGVVAARLAAGVAVPAGDALEVGVVVVAFGMAAGVAAAADEPLAVIG